MGNVVEGGKAPLFDYATLADMGYKLITFSGSLQRIAITGMREVATTLKRDGTTNAF
jgi:2-methylisocitrate lyase-like PEP mutase family enzyme